MKIELAKYKILGSRHLQYALWFYWLSNFLFRLNNLIYFYLDAQIYIFLKIIKFTDYVKLVVVLEQFLRQYMIWFFSMQFQTFFFNFKKKSLIAVFSVCSGLYFGFFLVRNPNMHILNHLCLLLLSLRSFLSLLFTFKFFPSFLVI